MWSDGNFHLVVEVSTDTTTLKKRLAISSNSENAGALCPCNPTPRESFAQVSKDMHKNVYYSFVQIPKTIGIL